MSLIIQICINNNLIHSIILLKLRLINKELKKIIDRYIHNLYIKNKPNYLYKNKIKWNKEQFIGYKPYIEIFNKNQDYNKPIIFKNYFTQHINELSFHIKLTIDKNDINENWLFKYGERLKMRLIEKISVNNEIKYFYNCKTESNNIFKNLSKYNVCHPDIEIIYNISFNNKIEFSETKLIKFYLLSSVNTIRRTVALHSDNFTSNFRQSVIPKIEICNLYIKN